MPGTEGMVPLTIILQETCYYPHFIERGTEALMRLSQVKGGRTRT